MSGDKKPVSFKAIYSKIDSLEKECKNMTVPELKEELGSRNLKLSGRKTFLVKRVLKAKISELLFIKTNRELRDELKRKGLSVSGAKGKKIDRLITYVSGLDKSSKSKSSDYSNMTVTQLKKELKSKGLPVSGVKTELIKRLRTSSNDYNKMTVKELRVELKKQGLPVSGNKKALVERLVSSKTKLNYNYMTVKELRGLLKAQGLTVSGNKAALISRLKISDGSAMNYSGIPGNYAYNLNGDSETIGKVAVGIIGFVLVIGFIALISDDSSYDDDYYASNYDGSGSSSSLTFNDERNYGDGYSSGSSSSSYNSGSSSSGMSQEEYDCYFVTGGCSLYDDYMTGSNYYDTGSAGAGYSYDGSTASGGSSGSYGEWDTYSSDGYTSYSYEDAYVICDDYGNCYYY